MLVQVTDNIWKINHDSNMYLIKASNEIIIIDSCKEMHKQEVKKEIMEICNPRDVRKVLFTHLHYDHIGNFELFENAKFYASKDEISFFRKDGLGAVLKKDIAERFGKNLYPLEDINDELRTIGFTVFAAPGHTIGSVLLLYGDILFSGDTYFGSTIYGRTDLPSSVPEKMPQTLKMLKQIQHKILCGGHDYL